MPVEKDRDLIEDMIAQPSNHFTTPHDVVSEPGLRRDDKVKILESWKLDAERLADSTAEAMTGGEQSNLREVSKALEKLSHPDAA